MGQISMEIRRLPGSRLGGNQHLADKHYVIDTWDRPEAQEIAPGTIIAFRMEDPQRVKDEWQAGGLMAKRAMATMPGTRIAVDADGVSFREPTGREWHYGKGLEAAEVLHQEPQAFYRDIVLGPGEIFMMGELPYAIDSRYYGVIRDSQIVGTVPVSW